MPRTQITPELVERMRRTYARTRNKWATAEELGLGQSAVGKYLNGAAETPAEGPPAGDGPIPGLNPEDFQAAVLAALKAIGPAGSPDATAAAPLDTATKGEARTPGLVRLRKAYRRVRSSRTCTTRSTTPRRSRPCWRS